MRTSPASVWLCVTSALYPMWWWPATIRSLVSFPATIQIGSLRWRPRRWVVITNHKHIRTRPTEAPKAVEHRLRVAHLDAGSPARVWDYLRLLLRHWDDVEALCEHPGPAWLRLDVQRATPTELAYEPGKPPRLAADPREDRLHQARAERRGRPSGAERRRRRRAPEGAQPGQLSLPEPASAEDDNTGGM